MTSSERRLKVLKAEHTLNLSKLKAIEERMLSVKVSSDEWSDLASKRNSLLVDIQVAEKKKYFAISEQPYLGSMEIKGGSGVD